MINIVLAGAGQIGSRHLQALKKLTIPASIWVFDSSEESLNISRQRYDSVECIGCLVTVTYTSTISDLPHHIDILLLTTGSKPRFPLFKTLTSYATIIRYVIFEKVLFQKIQEYKETADILKNKDINAWVNCNNRTFGFYRDIKSLLCSNNLMMTVTGGLWGLCCNSIHYIDLMAYLCECNSYTIDVSCLDKSAFDSKRRGYKEANGVLRLDFSNGSQLILQCGNVQRKTLLTITSKNTAIVYDDDKLCRWIISDKLNEVTNYSIPFQSQLTDILVEDIIETGSCLLPTYEESSLLHIPLIHGLISHFKDYSHDSCLDDNCPIT